jgi:hypothetical protein
MGAKTDWLRLTLTVNSFAATSNFSNADMAIDSLKNQRFQRCGDRVSARATNRYMTRAMLQRY